MNRHRKDGIDPVRRSRARRRALQAVYAMQVTGTDVRSLIAQFAHEQAHEEADLVYFEDLVRGVAEHRAALDESLAPFLDRGIEEVDPIERAALRIAAYELTHRPDVPYRVVINEAVELGKVYGGTDGYKYVNGVLDRIAAQLRKTEVESGNQSHPQAQPASTDFSPPPNPYAHVPVSHKANTAPRRPYSPRTPRKD